jgi:hypothetical protein
MGDSIAFLSALAAFVSVRSRYTQALVVVWVFKIFGALEFIHSMVRGSLRGASGSRGAFWFIPVAYVPLGLVARYLIFVLLFKRSREYAAQASVDRLTNGKV